MTLEPATFASLGSARVQVLRWLIAACRRPGCDLSTIDLIGLCVRGHAQLILIRSGSAVVAAGVSQVREHADGTRSAWVLALGGAAPGPWSAVMAVIEAGAAALGCETVAFHGRPGWRRLLPDYTATPCAAGLHFMKRLR